MSLAALLVPFAHFGHVLVDLPIFFGPVAVLSSGSAEAASAVV